MHDYRNRDKSPGTQPPSLVDDTTASIPAYETIATQYGLEDSDDPEITPSEQTVDEEYSAYATARRSPHQQKGSQPWAIYGCQSNSREA